MTKPPPAPVPTLGRFQLVRVLGEGAQGAVYLARDPHLGREVAIKTLQHVAAGQPDTVRRLLQEARTVSQLSHPNIVTLHDAGESAAQPYLVLEYVPGETLAQLLKRDAPLPPARAVTVALEILEGVAHAHERGFLHRDLKPGNVIFGGNGQARIMDFGIATSMRAGPGEGFACTPRYAAPEYLARGEYLPASDLYAVAAMLYEMLTGQAPIQGDSVPDIVARAQKEAPRPPSRLNGKVDDKLDALVLRGLAKRAEQRYATAREMADPLRAWLEPATPAAGSAATATASTSTIEFLLRRMRVKSEFPALSETIRNINRIAASDRESASTLAQVILKDFALTNRLLKIVNAASYGQYGNVSTISRAVVIVGFEVVRNLAVTLLFLDHLQNRAQAGNLKEDVVGSLLTGLIARQLSGDNLRESEELFICGLYQNLGKLLATYYFFEESQEIERQMASGKLTEEQAANRVLGVSYEQLGVEIARTWNFPERLVNSMRRLADGKVMPPRSPDDRVKVLANLAEELRQVLVTSGDEEREPRLKELVGRYQGSVPVDGGRLRAAVQAAVNELVRDAVIYRVDPRNSQQLRRAQQFASPAVDTGATAPREVDALGDADLDKTIVNGALDPAATLPGDGKPPNATAILSAGIQDITNTLVSEYQLNDLLNMIMETMYRGMGFARVLLAIRDVRTGTVAGRFALGERSDELLRQFRFPLAGTPDLMRLALSHGRDVLISDASAEKVRAQLPDWYRTHINAPGFALFPIVVGKNPVGVFYADARRAPLKIERDEANLLVTLRNQAVLAFKQEAIR